MNIRFNPQGEALFAGITMAEYKALQALSRRKANRWFEKNKSKICLDLFFKEEQRFDSFSKAKQQDAREAAKAARKAERDAAKKAKPLGRLSPAKLKAKGGLGKLPSEAVANYDKSGNLIFAGITLEQYIALEEQNPKRAEDWLARNSHAFSMEIFMDEYNRLVHRVVVDHEGITARVYL